ncbi:hypothetical protein ACWKSP_11485 [Micromonosporaceae bacterium Da 78-11]
MKSEADVASAVIPGQWAPAHDDLPAEPTPARRSRWAGLDLLIVLVLIATGVVVLGADRPRPATIAGATRPAAPVPPTPLEVAGQALDTQATALLRGDQKGWLAAVDPKQVRLRKHYADLYRSLRALHVTQFDYHLAPDGTKNGLLVANAEISYCLSATTATCPPYASGVSEGPPRFTQRLTLRPAAAGYLIVGLTDGVPGTDLQPTPWQAGDLVFAQGKRVTVAAPRALRGRLAEIVRIADRAAVVTDRIADSMANRQPRYRIYLATAKTWKTWYGGGLPAYTVGYTIPLNDAGSDVLLNVNELDFQEELEVTIQHELAHVATLSNLTYVDQQYTWLIEGVAEYAGWLPKRARQDWTYPAVRAAFRGSHPPKSMVVQALDRDAGQHAVDTFYGLNHFAVECMVVKYGERETMDFVRRALRLHEQPDVAATGAFGTHFDKVDKACVSWIRKQVGQPISNRLVISRQ